MRFKNISKRETRDTIKVTESALEKIAIMTDIMQGLEFGCISVTDKNMPNKGNRKIIDFIITHDQKVSGSECKASPKANLKSQKEINNNGLVQIGIAHGHGHNRGFHSPTDDEALMKSVLPSCAANNIIYLPSKNRPTTSISKVSSIVVNIRQDIYAEMWYREEDLTSKVIPPKKYSKETIVESIPDVSGQITADDKSQETIIQQLAARVFFPIFGRLPPAFQEYERQYQQLTSKRADKTLRRFSENLARYKIANNQYTEEIEFFIRRISAHCSSRLKYAYNTEPPFEQILDLFAFFTTQEDCPDWIFDFIKEGGKLGTRNKDQVIENYLDKIQTVFKPKVISQLSVPIQLDHLLPQKSINISPSKKIPILQMQENQVPEEYMPEVNETIRQARKLATEILFFKWRLPNEFSNKYVNIAGKYITETKQELTNLLEQTENTPDLQETKSLLQQQQNDLHSYISRQLLIIQGKIKRYAKIKEENKERTLEAETRHVEIQELIENARQLPSELYQKQIERLDKLLEVI
ncbi:hypothetical protein KY333_03220 [Candidatus Woesearchaeota archaeon]|nr:hypothetical protein [Candidatus Woesearchaeota archaeon]